MINFIRVQVLLRQKHHSQDGRKTLRVSLRVRHAEPYRVHSRGTVANVRTDPSEGKGRRLKKVNLEVIGQGHCKFTTRLNRQVYMAAVLELHVLTPPRSRWMRRELLLAVQRGIENGSWCVVFKRLLHVYCRTETID